jgi:hypothetical protein
MGQMNSADHHLDKAHWRCNGSKNATHDPQNRFNALNIILHIAKEITSLVKTSTL